MYLLETMITPVSIEGNTYYNLTGIKNARGSLANYTMPLAGNVDAYLAHVLKYAAEDEPEVFGIHENAKFALANKEGENVLIKISEYLYSDQNDTSKSNMKGKK